MTIKSSGPISISHINTELGLAANTNKNLGNTAVRTLLQRLSGAVPLSSAYGKSNIKLDFNMVAAAHSGFIGTYYGWEKGIFGSSDTNPVRYNPTGVGEVLGLVYWDANGTGVLWVTENMSNVINVSINGVDYTFNLDSQDVSGVYYVCNFSYSNPFQPGGTYSIKFR